MKSIQVFIIKLSNHQIIKLLIIVLDERDALALKLEEALLHFNAMKEEVIEINKTKSVILNMVHYILINNLVINVTNSYSISYLYLYLYLAY
jgi:hypothetical protein